MIRTQWEERQAKLAVSNAAIDELHEATTSAVRRCVERLDVRVGLVQMRYMASHIDAAVEINGRSVEIGEKIPVCTTRIA